MKNQMLRWPTTLLAALLFLSLPAGAAQYILSVTAGANVAQVASQHGLLLVRSITDDGQTVFLVSYPDPAPATLVKQVLADPAVVRFEPDEEVVSRETPTSAPVINLAELAAAIQNHNSLSYFGAMVRASYVQQPAATLIELPQSQSVFGNGANIVAVIDTGVDPTHPALKGVLVPGYDFTRNEAGFASELADLTQSTVAILDQSTVAILDSKNFPELLNQSTVAILDQSTVAILDGAKLPSDFGHGTMVAGLIHLVAPSARIMPLKAFHADGSANLSDIVRAVYYAVDNHAKVINMSFSSLTQSPTLSAAIEYAWSHDVICVASGGNNGKSLTVYPAADHGVLGVGSTNNKDERSFFSNYDVEDIRLAAPGEALITTYPGNNYAGVWGTSFSTALTSGAAALLTQLSQQTRPASVFAALEHGHKLAFDLGNARLDVLSSLLYFMAEKSAPKEPDN